MSHPDGDSLDYRLLRTGSARLDAVEPPEDIVQESIEGHDRWEMLSKVVEDILIDGEDDITAETQECRALFQKITGVNPQSSDAPWREGRERKDGERFYTDAEARVSEVLISVSNSLEASGCRPSSTAKISRSLRMLLRKMLKTTPTASEECDTQEAEEEHDTQQHMRTSKGRMRKNAAPTPRLPRTRALQR